MHLLSIKNSPILISCHCLLNILSLLYILPGVAGGWQTVRSQSLEASGTGFCPSIRYGHTCHSYKGKLLTTHGYYYDRQRSLPTWLSDTWALDVANGLYTWQRLSDNLAQSEAFAAYSGGRTPRAPCGRFGHVSALINDALLLYGGNDGGYSRTDRHDYRPGNDFDELWRLDLNNRTWSLLRPDGGGPGKRHMAGAIAVQGKFILYGGIGRDRGDVWSYSSVQNQWELLSKEISLQHGGPGSRCGHGMFPWVTDQAAGFIVYGGQSQLADNSYMVHDDSWFFDLATRHWRKLLPAPDTEADGGTAVKPDGHFYQAAMVTILTLPPSAVSAARGSGGKKVCRDSLTARNGEEGAPEPVSSTCDDAGPHHHTTRAAAVHSEAPLRVHVGVIAGGSTTTPGLTCSAQAWAFTTDCAVNRIIWARLPDLPAAMYDTRGAAVAGAAYVFGGHLCSLEHPPRQPYQFYYVNEALRLDLGLGLDQIVDLDLELSQSFGSESKPGVAALLRGGLVREGDVTAETVERAAACGFRLKDDVTAAASSSGRQGRGSIRGGPPPPAGAASRSDEL